MTGVQTCALPICDVEAAYGRIAEAVSTQRRAYVRYRMLEGGHAFASDSFGLARNLLRAGDELPKPNGERLKEFGDARRESFELQLFSEKPIHEDLEIVMLTEALTIFAELSGFNDPLVQKVLAGQSPANRAAALINGTKVRDVAFRKRLHAEIGRAHV